MTQTYFKSKLEMWRPLKSQKELLPTARAYKNICDYTQRLFKDCKNVEIKIDNNHLNFSYTTGKTSGSARMFLKHLDCEILLPILEKITEQYGYKINNPSVLIAA